MTNIVQSKHDRQTLRQIYDEFILWFAMPTPEKEKMGIENQTEFAREWEISDRTCSRWKERDDFESRVRQLRKKWAFDKTGDVIYGIYRSSVKGNDKSQKLWMQIFEGFTEKQEVTHTLQVEVSVKDIRFLIEGLPEPLRTKHYDNLTELLIDADKARRTGEFEDDSTDRGLEAEIQDETIIDAPDLSNLRANEIPGSYRERLCQDLEWQVSPHNHKSASRGW